MVFITLSRSTQHSCMMKGSCCLIVEGNNDIILKLLLVTIHFLIIMMTFISIKFALTNH